MPAYVVTIGGVERDALLDSLDLRASLNRVPVLACDVVSDDGTYRPAMDDEVIVTEDSATIFGGLVQSPETRGESGPAVTAIVTRVEAVGFAAYADRRWVNGTLAAGTLKSQLETVVAYLADYGVTLDAAQVDGPDMDAMIVDYRKVTDVLNDLSSLSAGVGGSPDAPYFWEIDGDKVLRMFQAGTLTAPADVTSDSPIAIGDVLVSRSSRGYANRVILRSAGDRVTTANNITEQGDRGLTELLVDTRADLSADVADRAAAGILAQSAITRVEVRYETNETGVRPGQVQTITATERNVDGTFVVTDVAMRREPNGVGLRRAITAVSDGTLRGSWQDVLSRWSTGVGGVGVVGSGGASGAGAGGDFGGPGGSTDCRLVIAPGSLAFSGFGYAPMLFYAPSGDKLGVPASAPQIGTGGVEAMVAFPSGKVAITGANYPAPNFESTLVYDAQFATILGYDQNSVLGIQPSYTTDGVYYAVRNPGGSANAEAWKFSDGVKVDSWDLGDHDEFYFAFAMQPDESVAYLPDGSGAVKAIDLVSSTASTFATEAGEDAQSLFVLPNGNVLVAWDTVVKRYDSDGSTLATYTPPGDNVGIIYVTIGRWNGTSFWVQYYADDVPTYSTIRLVEYSIDGALLHSFDPEDGTFDFDGMFCVLRVTAT